MNLATGALLTIIAGALCLIIGLIIALRKSHKRFTSQLAEAERQRTDITNQLADVRGDLHRKDCELVNTKADCSRLAAQHADAPQQLQRALASVQIYGERTKELSNVFAKALECYAQVLPQLRENEEAIRDNIVETKRLLAHSAFRRETVRTILCTWLLHYPDNKEVLKMFRDLLEATPEIVAEGAESAFFVALCNIPHLSEISDEDLVDFLLRGFAGAVMSWPAFGESFDYAFGQVLNNRQHLGPLLDKLLGSIQTHIANEGDPLLEETRAPEYKTLCSFIVLIHKCQGHNRKQRPQNRHVATVEPRIDIALELLDGVSPHFRAAGHIVNFAVGLTKDWQGGAWIEGPDGRDWPACKGPSHWQRAKVTLTHPLLEPPMDFAASLNGPYKISDNLFGFRITWGEPSVDMAKGLSLLGKQFKLKR